VKPRVVHYLNQFFGGIGAEEHASLPPRFAAELAGPSRLLQRLLGEDAAVVGTLICGDNYAHDERKAALRAIGAVLDEQRPALVIAGPAFDAGRYGLACDAVCHLAIERRISAVTGMHPENPALATSRRLAYVVPTTAQALGLKDALTSMAAIGRKLLCGEALGPAAVENYLPRGTRLNVLSEHTAAERAVRMLHGRLEGQPFTGEIPLTTVDAVEPAPPLANLCEAVIAIVTEAGIVPRGNPFRLPHAHAQHWAKYSVAGLEALRAGDFEGVHGGFDNRYVNDEPGRAVPLDLLRALEREGTIKALHETIYVTVGNGTPVPLCARFGQEIAAELREAGVTGVIVPST
jgi:betaine reductase